MDQSIGGYICVERKSNRKILNRKIFLSFKYLLDAEAPVLMLVSLNVFLKAHHAKVVGQ